MLIRLVGTEKMAIFVVLKEVHIQKYPITISDDWVLYYLNIAIIIFIVIIKYFLLHNHL